MKYFIFMGLLLVSISSPASENVDGDLRNAAVKKFKTSQIIKRAFEEACTMSLKKSEPTITVLHNHTLDFANAYEPILVIQDYKCGSHSNHMAALIPTNMRFNSSTKTFEFAMKSPEVVPLTYRN